MDLSKCFPLRVDAEFKGYRLDRFLAESFPEVSRARWTKLIDKKVFNVGAKCVEASYRLEENDELVCDVSILEKELQQEVTLEAQVKFKGTAPEVVFEDEDVLIINKPVGLAGHPGAALPLEQTLMGWLLEQHKIEVVRQDDHLSWDDEVIEDQRPGIVHRLDRGTSGLMVVAKNPAAHSFLAAQFANKTAGRLYWALVQGELENLKTTRPRRVDELAQMNPSPMAFSVKADALHSLATFLERDPAHRTRFRVSRGEGRHALTYFREIARGAGHLSLLELKLATGRTHQIRVHLSFLGFPILGDENYGGIPSTRVWLHAHTLYFMHPKTQKLCLYSCPWPEADARWLKSQGIQSSSRFVSEVKNS